MPLNNFLRALFPSLVTIPTKTSKAAATKVAHDLVRSYACGNVNLQRGRYMTSEQLEARKRRLAQPSF